VHLRGRAAMLLTILKFVAYAWLGALLMSSVVLGLLFTLELVPRAIQRRRRSSS
jgi:hypothetical protein